MGQPPPSTEPLRQQRRAFRMRPPHPWQRINPASRPVGALPCVCAARGFEQRLSPALVAELQR
jgi:hypothetical protein